jgi:hypothetical protein
MSNAAPAPAVPPDLAARLDFILAPLALLVAAKFRILGRWTNPLYFRPVRANRRLARILARVAAGKAPRRRVRKPCPGGPPPLRIPTAHAWLLKILRHEAALFTHRFERLFADPAALAVLAAAPGAAATLRPICRLLAVPLPPALRPPRRERPSAPRRRRTPPTPAPTPSPASGGPASEPPANPAPRPAWSPSGNAAEGWPFANPFCPRALRRWPWRMPPQGPPGR